MFYLKRRKQEWKKNQINKKLSQLSAMKRYYLDLLLIINIFFIAFAFAEELQYCSDKTVYAVHKERPIVRLTDSKRAQGISQISKARGVNGGDSIIKPKGKKNRAMTTSASLALLHVTIAILVHIFLY